MTEIYAVNIYESVEYQEFQKMLSVVTQDTREKIEHLHFIDDVKRTLYGNVLVRYLIARKLGLENQEIRLSRNDHGKPFLTEYSNFQYNVSHAGKWIVCAVGENPVGIDIEQIREIDMGIAGLFFAQEECQALLKQNEQDRLSYFFDLWTLKESYIKYEGKGLSIPLHSFCFKKQMDTFAVYKEGSRLDLHFRQYQLDGCYTISVCAQKDDFVPEPRIVSLKSIMPQMQETLAD